MESPSAVPALIFWDKSPPAAALVAASISGCVIDLQPDSKASRDTPVILRFSDGEELSGLSTIMSYLGRCAAASTGLYGDTPLAACQIDKWLEFMPNIVSGSALEFTCRSLDDYLSLRTFFVGYNLTIADIAIWGQLQATPVWKKISSSGKTPHLSRWFEFCLSLPDFRQVAEHASVRRKPLDEQSTSSNSTKGASGAGGSFDIGLPGAEMGKVVTRFPPEPSGYLHIGHAKAALLNQYFAELYKGKLLVRFDDTNPSKEKDEFVENIIKDIADLGLRYEQLTYTSDYFPEMEDLAVNMIKAGTLYADDTPVDQMREERMEGIESKCRNRPVEETLHIFEEMKQGSEVGLVNCLRLKMDMQALNKALRDPVAYRCNLTPHWRTGTKYKVYPTYDFACPFVDSVEGVTHALRSSEYKDREAQYYWVLRMQQQIRPDLQHVHMWDFSRLNFVHTVLSKRKLLWFVNSGKVEGWDDPRMPTVQGVLRRGMTVEALKKFIISQGASKNVTLQEWDKIWTINKQIIDPVCPRHTAVEVAGRVAVRLSGAPPEELVSVPRHKKHPPAGVKVLRRGPLIWIEQRDAALLKDGEEFTLMDWGNAIVQVVHRSAEGAVESIDASLHLSGDVKRTKWKLTWLADSSELVPLILVDFDHLINKKKIEEDDDFVSLVNEETRFETAAQGDANMRSLQRRDIIQLERKGYYIVDQPLMRAGRPLVLFSIPDGRNSRIAVS